MPGLPTLYIRFSVFRCVRVNERATCIYRCEHGAGGNRFAAHMYMYSPRVSARPQDTAKTARDSPDDPRAEEKISE